MAENETPSTPPATPPTEPPAPTPPAAPPTPPAEEADDDPKGKSVEGLIDEKKKLRKRAQTAEKELAELKTAHEELNNKHNDITKQLEGFTFKETRSSKLDEVLKAIPDDKHVPEKNMPKVQKYIGKLTNLETLEADIADIVKDFVVEKPATPETPSSPFSILKAITTTPPAPVLGEVEIDASNPFKLLQLGLQNPAAFEKAMKAEPSKAK